MADFRLRNDAELLEFLGRVLFSACDPGEPSPRAIADLRRAVAQRAQDRRSRLWWRKAAVGAGAVMGVVAGGTGAAFAAGAVPEPVRAAAYDLGLPVNSPALSSAIGDENRLRAAIERASAGDRSSARAATVDADRLKAQLLRLKQSDRRQLGGTAQVLLSGAAAYNYRVGTAATDPSSTRSEGTSGAGAAPTGDSTTGSSTGTNDSTTTTTSGTGGTDSATSGQAGGTSAGGGDSSPSTTTTSTSTTQPSSSGTGNGSTGSGGWDGGYRGG